MCFRSTFDRQDSVRSDYMSDRESRYGIVQQPSLESTDSRLCYLTSSEVSWFSSCWPYRFQFLKSQRKEYNPLSHLTFQVHFFTCRIMVRTEWNFNVQMIRYFSTFRTLEIYQLGSASGRKFIRQIQRRIFKTQKENLRPMQYIPFFFLLSTIQTWRFECIWKNQLYFFPAFSNLALSDYSLTWTTVSVLLTALHRTFF